MSLNRTAILSLLLSSTLAAASVAARQQALAPVREDALVLSNADKEVFLRNAEIGEMTIVEIGVTKPKRACLDDGTLQHDAQIQTIDRSWDPNGPFANFRDYYKFNIAAYRLASLLGFERVPVSVERTVEGEKAAVTWWIDDVAMMELEREEGGIQPPDPADFDHQMWQVRIFSQLVHNTDLNPANIVITDDWKLWLIDFTRAFRVDQQIDRAELAGRICRRYFQAIRDLDEEVVRAELGPHLTEREIEVVLKGRDEIVAHFDEQAAARGETAVFCDEAH